jgi:hypothetical protein
MYFGREPHFVHYIGRPFELSEMTLHRFGGYLAIWQWPSLENFDAWRMC